MKEVKFNVQGMTCSSCSAHVEKAVSKLKYIVNVNVNLLSNNMIVKFDENFVNEEDIINAVIDAGYGATLVSDEVVFPNERIKNNELHKSDAERSKSNESSEILKVISSMKKRVIVSFCFWIPLMYVAMHHMFHSATGIPMPQFIVDLFDGTNNALIFAFTQLLLLLPIIYANKNYFIIGFKRLFKGVPTMDSLVALGSFSAIAYGIYAIYMIGYGLGHNQMDIVEKFSKDLYFESAGTILTLITFGKYLETKSKGKTTAAIEKLINLAPKTAIVERDNKEVSIPTDEIKKDDIVIIKPGSNIPVDGVITEGTSTIDESSITGESIPVLKVVGDDVVSGTINKNGYIKIKATKVGEDTTLSQIVKLVEEASNSKAPISKIADKVSAVFVPIVILIAVVATIFWLLNGQSFEFTLSIGISVLVISCPCALGLATPVAIMVGTGKGATQGILIKSAENLEVLHKIDTVVLDKTGTITEGKPKVIDIITNSSYKDLTEIEFLKIASSLEKNSEHPLAEAIVEKAKKEKLNLYEIEDFKQTLGRGVAGTINNEIYYGGNFAFMTENNICLDGMNTYKEKIKSLLNKGKTVLYFADNKNFIGAIAVADTIKETSYEAVQQLKNKKLNVIMLTGDNRAVADAIGKEVGIDNVIAEVLPQDKEKEVAKLQNTGKKVAFVGDGINDSPALVRADVGIALGSGTDIAIESADIVLKNDKLTTVNTAIDLSSAVIRNIKMNLFWAFFYNCIGIPVAAGAFYLSYGLKLNPMIGAAAMSLSSVCVVTNALSLNFFKPKKGEIFMNIKEISIDGMQCNHCKMTVEKVLGALEGVTKVEVSLEKKNAIIESSKVIEDEKIKAIIEEAGFSVNEIK